MIIEMLLWKEYGNYCLFYSRSGSVIIAPSEPENAEDKPCTVYKKREKKNINICLQK